MRASGQRLLWRRSRRGNWTGGGRRGAVAGAALAASDDSIGNSDCIIEIDCEGNILQNNDCVADDGIPIEMIILISSISGGAVIGVTAILLIIRKRKRI